MENSHKRHDRDVVAFIKTSLYSTDVQTSIYTAYLLNYSYDRHTDRWVDALEYDIVDEGLFIGGKYKDEQNKTLADLCNSFLIDGLVVNLQMHTEKYFTKHTHSQNLNSNQWQIKPRRSKLLQKSMY